MTPAVIVAVVLKDGAGLNFHIPLQILRNYSPFVEAGNAELGGIFATGGTEVFVHRDHLHLLLRNISSVP